MVFNAVEWKSLSELTHNPQLTRKQSQVTICDPEAQEVISGVQPAWYWTEATVKSFYPNERDFPNLLINSKWNTQTQQLPSL